MRDDVRFMLKALSTGGSEPTAAHAKEILESKVSLLQAMNGFHGGFLKSVVNGDILGALHHADLTNQQVLGKSIVAYLTSYGALGNAD